MTGVPVYMPAVSAALDGINDFVEVVSLSIELAEVRLDVGERSFTIMGESMDVFSLGFDHGKILPEMLVTTGLTKMGSEFVAE